MSRNYKFHNRPENYLYSSAIDYAGDKSILDNVIVI